MSRRIKIAKETFPNTAGLIRNGTWGYLKEIEDPGKIVSALLIEGYGLYLEEVYQKRGLARTFVIAFEEVLGTEYPNSSLFRDIRGWILEEGEDFPQEFINQIKNS